MSNTMINIFEPNIGRESIEKLIEVFDSKWLGRGKYVDQFEDIFGKLLKFNVGGITTLSSCSDAIFSVFDIFNLDEGDEVLISSISFPAIGNACIAKKLNYKIIDVDKFSGNVTLKTIEKELTKKTKAIFVTHYGGIPLNIQAIRKLVGKSVFIFEDAACALGSESNEIPSGTEGDFGCWSFDAMKIITCGEGGAVYLKDNEKLKKAKQLYYLGLPLQTKSGIDRSNIDQRWWEYEIELPGRRSVFTNINAAIGLPQINEIDKILDRRKKIRKFYEYELDMIGLNYSKQDNPNDKYSNYFFTIISPHRDELANYLKSNNIYTTFRYYPLNKLKINSNLQIDCPNADWFSLNALNIPIHQNLTDDDIQYIVNKIRKFFNVK